MYVLVLSWKWLSVTATGGTALILVNEVLRSDLDIKHGRPLGFYSHVQYRFARQWWVGLGGSLARDANPLHDHDEEVDEAEGLRTIKQVRANLTLSPSEFSAVRLEVHYDQDTQSDYQDLSVFLQVNFTIGSHPAHAY